MKFALNTDERTILKSWCENGLNVFHIMNENTFLIYKLYDKWVTFLKNGTKLRVFGKNYTKYQSFFFTHMKIRKQK